MTIAPHTPTPWELEKPLTGGIFISKQGGQPIASMCGYYPKEFEANAEFIVKACNQYDKVVEALRTVSRMATGLYSQDHAGGRCLNPENNQITAYANKVLESLKNPLGGGE